ncbi:hypothetical protein KQH50_01825 [bacterium]|nr:hypothetical protein [bacterium]
MSVVTEKLNCGSGVAVGEGAVVAVSVGASVGVTEGATDVVVGVGVAAGAHAPNKSIINKEIPINRFININYGT